MFNYTDPTGGNFGGDATVAAIFRTALDRLYDVFAKRQASAFAWLEAMDALQNGAKPIEKKVDWRAFPLTAPATDRQIDAQRAQFAWFGAEASVPLLKERIIQYRDRVEAALGNPATRQAELTRLFGKLVAARKTMLDDPTTHPLDETGDLFPRP